MSLKNDASSSHDGRSNGASIIDDHGRRRSTCGYCKSPARSSTSHGLSAETLTVYDYQALIDRGWRRSGSYLYKHEMDKTCCPPYTIRLKASDFVPTKEQQRVSRRLERFLDGKLDVQPREQTGASSSREVSDARRKTFGAAKSEEKNKVEPIMDDLSKKIDQAVQLYIQSGEFPSDMQIPKASVKKVLCARRKKLAEGTEKLLYTSNIAFPIAAAIKRTQKSEKGGINSAEGNRLSPETISEMLLSAMHKVGETHDMSIKVCKGHINFFSAAKDSFSRGANSTGGSETLHAKKDSENHQARKRKLEIHLKRSSFDPEEHELYKRYQLKVHNDKPEHVAESSYRRFLVDSPLIDVQPSGDEKLPPCGFGSFHQQYRVDGLLIAVGVVDILPKCLSSVYLFWDPDYAFLSLGKYSAMQEINWVIENQAHCPSLQYYYLGYYIHSCRKMRYKAAYCPSELLCPLRFQWVPFEIARPMLDKKPYVILSDIAISQNQCSLLAGASETLAEPAASEHEDMEQGETNDNFMGCSDDEDEDDDEMDETESEDSHIESDPGSKDNDINNILIGLYGSQYRYKDMRQIITPVGRKQLEPMLQSYRKVVGDELSERMVYEIN
ncbi:arginyl-tRNA--protein transferase 1 isoform X2 [Arabidopsis lyrata subsp. lyrata]|uniref:arginyl-tRNA--protein transferase 1 isoform X2 n=1 Tax=Arabidopsis lyrata subsp. lyrata TaxID=81972 RepID=UPI000A29BC75|nr:arginyl-tRNA--protein transferase 1 isoform X2 [Arabidopsis lyrata subsp. lyrata]|eukprot:XP_020875942.1 arginyl-tRNA--protein transferase 1 isoform X2 [Arabidopsis lyrata subsp. lyrata]